jgi:[CysO sulfur-carrier protein]-S-L-cysteine hydrolase
VPKLKEKQVINQYVFMKKSVWNKMIEHCLLELPNEACGLLSGKKNTQEEIWEMDNINKSPYTFEMNPIQIELVLYRIKQCKQSLSGIYHSHPTADPIPSFDDIENIVYPETPYFIVSFKNEKPDVKCYLINNKEINHLGIKLF